jgi:hypothetical protein
MPNTLPIDRSRGDTYRIGLTFKESDGSLIDLSGGTITLTVNEENAPDDTANELFQSVGVDGDLTNGYAHFPLTADDADHLGRFYYDIEFIDANGKKRTLLEGEYLVSQDITKSDEEYIWTPDASLSDGSDYSSDGSDEWWLTTHFASDNLIKHTRDTLPVLRWEMDTAENNSSIRTVVAYGPSFPRTGVWWRGWEFEILAYLNKAALGILLVTPGWWDNLELRLDNRTGGDPSVLIGSRIGADWDYPAGPSTTGWGSDWFRMAARITENGDLFVRTWVEGGTEGSWIAVNAGNQWVAGVPFAVEIGALYDNPTSGDAYCDLAEYIWRRL